MGSCSQDNKYLGRHLDPNVDPPFSFKEKKHKELSDMYQRILIGLGLAPQLCTKYVRQSRKTEGLMHTPIRPHWMHSIWRGFYPWM
jgi:hypothetical protein